MTINETQLFEYLDSAEKPILVEPNYKRKYPPLGLAKIATYLDENGTNFSYTRNYSGQDCDIAFITSLFTYDADKVLAEIDSIRFFKPGIPIVIGGVYATLMTKKLDIARDNLLIFSGYSKKLDQLKPLYDFDWGVDAVWNQFSFIFTTRGCPNNCAYCAVWRIEPDIWVNPKWKELIGDHPCVMISDNNLSSMPKKHLLEVIRYMRDTKKKVVFDNGFDCKFITKEMAELLAQLKYTRSGMRLAFDRIEEDGVFQTAVTRLLDAGVPKSQIMAYVLFNFKDTPQEANYRMEVCKKLGIRPYPQQYNPLNKTSRKPPYVGKYWTPHLMRVFRYFWLMSGFYTKTTFEEYVKERERLSDDKNQLTKEDWEAWNHVPNTEHNGPSPTDGQREKIESSKPTRKKSIREFEGRSDLQDVPNSDRTGDRASTRRIDGDRQEEDERRKGQSQFKPGGYSEDVPNSN